jgi:hypothetical protein
MKVGKHAGCRHAGGLVYHYLRTDLPREKSAPVELTRGIRAYVFGSYFRICLAFIDSHDASRSNYDLSRP